MQGLTGLHNPKGEGGRWGDGAAGTQRARHNPKGEGGPKGRSAPGKGPMGRMGPQGPRGPPPQSRGRGAGGEMGTQGPRDAPRGPAPWHTSRSTRAIQEFGKKFETGGASSPMPTKPATSSYRRHPLPLQRRHDFGEIPYRPYYLCLWQMLQLVQLQWATMLRARFRRFRCRAATSWLLLAAGRVLGKMGRLSQWVAEANQRMQCRPKCRHRCQHLFSRSFSGKKTASQTSACRTTTRTAVCYYAC